MTDERLMPSLAPRYVSQPPTHSLLDRAYVISLPSNFYFDGTNYHPMEFLVEDAKKWRYCYVYPFASSFLPVAGRVTDPLVFVASKFYFNGNTSNAAYVFPWFGQTILSIVPTNPTVNPSPTINGLVGVAYFTTYPFRYLGLA